MRTRRRRSRGSPQVTGQRALALSQSLTVGELEDWLWKAACSIRGPIDAPKFKDYILPLVFVKRLSDVFEDEVSRLAGKFGDREQALELISDDHSLVRFYLPTECSWDKIRGLTSGIGQRLTEILRTIAKANASLQGVIDVVDFNATISGQRIVEDARLSTLIEILSRHRLGLKDVEPDILGRAYEFLLRKFAEDGGQSAGEFFTPKEVGWLLAGLLRPHEGMEAYDPACGSAGLLIKLQLTLRGTNRDIRRPLHLFGQERNPTTYAIAKMNMIVHDMEGEIVLGDTLINPRFLAGNGLKTFDLVAANPMWNQPGYGEGFYETDRFGRFGFGHPPAGTADWGWLQHMLTSLSKEGKGAVVLDAASMTRGSGEDSQNKEKQIRRRFVEADLIEGVVLLPDNLFYNTTAQGLIVLMNKAKSPERRDQIILVDASSEFEREKPKNVLTDTGMRRVIEAFVSWQSEEGFSRVVSREEVTGKDFNLNPARYVSRPSDRASTDIEATIANLAELRSRQAAIEELVTRMVQSVTTSGSDGVPNGWKTYRFGDVATFQLGRTPARKQKSFFAQSDGQPWVTITDLANQVVVKGTKERISEQAVREVFRSRFVPAGTLLMTIKLTVGRTGFMGVDGFHNEAIVSVFPNEAIVLPKFLYYLLPLIDYRQYQDRAVKGQTINLGKVRQMNLVLPPVEEQRAIIKVLDKLQELVGIERSIVQARVSLSRELVYQLILGQKRVS